MNEIEITNRRESDHIEQTKYIIGVCYMLISQMIVSHLLNDLIIY